MFRDENSNRYFKAIYPVGFLLTVVPLVDIGLRVFPPKFDTVQWRFAAVGLLAGNLGTVMLGLALTGLIATFVGHRKVLKVLGIVSMVAGVLLVAALGMFLLDALQVRRTVNPNFKQALTVSSFGALFTGGLGIISLFSIGVGAWVASKVVARRPAGAAAGRGPSKAAPSPLVVPTPNSGESTT